MIRILHSTNRLRALDTCGCLTLMLAATSESALKTKFFRNSPYISMYYVGVFCMILSVNARFSFLIGEISLVCYSQLNVSRPQKVTFVLNIFIFFKIRVSKKS